ncbi:hypothetical protein J6590_019730 [Homalodisca vitripennis]|nr:hypothetical protein J6590_019730 [Homalodisca vitripennis]
MLDWSSGNWRQHVPPGFHGLPDLTFCDFFLWGFIKDNVYAPPLPQNLEELKNRIHTAITSVMKDMLARVWEEFEYRCDIAHVVDRGHIEHLYSELDRFVNMSKVYVYSF